jgi:NTP pyrophosphatase (non-canonical NTP hydrolase)
MLMGIKPTGTLLVYTSEWYVTPAMPARTTRLVFIKPVACYICSWSDQLPTHLPFSTCTSYRSQNLPAMDFLYQCLGHRPKTTTAIQLIDGDSARAADTLINTIFLAEKNGLELRKSLEEIIRTNSWRQNFAKAVFEAMQHAIETARPMGDALREVYDKVACVVYSVEGFVRDHPIVCALIALGILVLLAPWVIEALGFAEGGILEGENCTTGFRYAATVFCELC